MKHLIHLACLACFFQMSAQTHGDCTSALLICNKSPLQIAAVQGPGADNSELNDATCFLNGSPGNIESNSYWIKFKAAHAGSLYFVITPNQPNDDIDFVLYRLQGDGDCSQKHLLRCMAAGESSGVDSSPCLGPTGLLPGETDTLEDAGCNDLGDNNFLAPVDLQTDSTYVLCVQNFSSFNGFSVKFCGTALLGCETEACFDITKTQTPEQSGFQVLNLYPNPTTGRSIWLDMEMAASEVMTFALVNALGQVVSNVTRAVPSGRQAVELPVGNLPAGMFFIQISTAGKSLVNKRFLKQ